MKEDSDMESLENNVLVKKFQWLLFLLSKAEKHAQTLSLFSAILLKCADLCNTCSKGLHILCHGTRHMKSGCEAKGKQGQWQHCGQSSRDLSSRNACRWDIYIRSRTEGEKNKFWPSQLAMVPTSCGTCEKTLPNAPAVLCLQCHSDKQKAVLLRKQQNYSKLW